MRFPVLKRKGHGQLPTRHRISQPHGDFVRVGVCRYFRGIDRVGELSRSEIDNRRSKCMAPDKSVIPPLDHMPLVDRFLFPESMDEIPHHRGMVSPTGGWLLHLPVAPEKAAPRSLRVAEGKTDRLGSGARNGQA